MIKTLFAYFANDKRLLEIEQELSLFGTHAFHMVWEKVCASVFDNKLGQPISSLGIQLAPEYIKQRNTRLIDLIEKPKWIASDVVLFAQDTLIPDLISIWNDGTRLHFIIFDAKYYLLQLENGKKLSGNPGIGDITKQYLYQLAYKDFIQAHRFGAVKNCFLMPTDGDEILAKGIARLEMLSNFGLEDILIRQIPAQLMYAYYISNRKIDIGLLKL